MNYELLIKKIDKFTKTRVKTKRYEHSVRVAQMCALLCKKCGIDEQKGYLVGIGHDMCKDFPEEKLIKLAKKDGEPLLDYDLRKPKLLHGRAAAVMMKKKFKIKDRQMLEAVAIHTSGKIGMCDLSKCLFLADKIEPGRPQSTDEYREKLLAMSLDEMFKTVLLENFNYIVNKGFEVYPGTDKMVEYYRATEKKD